MYSWSTGGVALVLAARLCAGQASPAGRAHHTLFYDDARQRVVLTGGTTVDSRRNYELLNDVWTFDGVAWTALPPSGNRMSGMRVAVDAAQRVYSFGGWNDTSRGDLRVLENDRWRRIGVHPAIVAAEGGFVFDASRARFVAFGGASAAQTPVTDVWEYDGARWSKNDAAPPTSRSSHAMVYDAQRKRIVVFGGMGARAGSEVPTIRVSSTTSGRGTASRGRSWPRTDLNRA